MSLLSATWEILCQLAPWLLLGMLIAGLLHVLLPAGFIHRKLRGPWGVCKSVALGVPLPLCSCGVVPTGIGLKRDGASDGASVGFLISTPQTGIDAILVSASLLGWPFALFKVVSAAVTGVIGGFLADAVQPPSGPQARGDSGGGPPPDRTLRGLLQHALEILHSIWIWLVVGIAVSVLIETFVPESIFARVAAWGSLPAALVALSISLPLYVCATASVPIAAVLVSNGLPAGAALVFLMAGPATNVATIGAIYRTFGWRTFAVYLGTIVSGSILFAVFFDWLLPAAAAAEVGHAHHPITWWSQACAVVLVALLGWFAVDDLRGWWQHRRSSAVDLSAGMRVSVGGMTCDGCVRRLEKALQHADGVDQVVVQLEPGQAIVRGSIQEDRLRQVIQETGFQPGKPCSVGE